MFGYWLFTKDENRAYCFVWEYKRALQIKRSSKTPLYIEKVWINN